MRQLRRHSIEINVVTEHSAQKVFVTPEFFKLANTKDSEWFVNQIRLKIRSMEKQDQEIEKMHKKKGTPLPTESQLLSLING